MRALTENRLDWWGTIAPGVTAPVPLIGAANPSYVSPLQVTLSATGRQPTAVTLTDVVDVHGGGAPGRYAMSVREQISHGNLVITQWAIQPS